MEIKIGFGDLVLAIIAAYMLFVQGPESFFRFIIMWAGFVVVYCIGYFIAHMLFDGDGFGMFASIVSLISLPFLWISEKFLGRLWGEYTEED